MENSLKKQFLVDTSAFISLESVNLLKQVINLFNIITVNSVINELKDFSKHNDKYGIIAKRVLKFTNKISMEDTDVKEQIRYLQNTNNELFNLALKKKIPLVSDDHKLVHHTKDKIDIYFSTFFLTAFVTAEIISKKESLGMLEKLRDIRNWKNNIIYLL